MLGLATARQLSALEDDLRLAKSLIRMRALPRAGALPQENDRRAFNRRLKVRPADLGCAELPEKLRACFGMSFERHELRIQGGTLRQKILCALAAAAERERNLAFIACKAPLEPEKSFEYNEKIADALRNGCTPVLVFTGFKGGKVQDERTLLALNNIFYLGRDSRGAVIFLTDAEDPDSEPREPRTEFAAYCKLRRDPRELSALLRMLLHTALADELFTDEQYDRLGLCLKDQGEAATAALQALHYRDTFSGAALARVIGTLALKQRGDSDPLEIAKEVHQIFYKKARLSDQVLRLYYRDPAADDRDPDEQNNEPAAAKPVKNVYGIIYETPEDDKFDPRLVCSEQSTEPFIARLRHLSDKLRAGETIAPHSGTALLWGPPGTGKTEFAQHIGKMLGREVEVVTGGDLLRSKWGKTERCIEDCLMQAQKAGRVLVIDEVDYLMGSRDSQACAFERSMVDQFLAALGSYRGLLIGTTNSCGLIDQAIKRRYSQDFRFTFANKDQLRLLWDLYAKDCALSPLNAEETSRLLALRRLTPGEFQNLRNRHDPECCPKVSAAELIGELVSLTRFRDGDGQNDHDARRIGFV